MTRDKLAYLRAREHLSSELLSRSRYESRFEAMLWTTRKHKRETPDSYPRSSFDLACYKTLYSPKETAEIDRKR